MTKRKYIGIKVEIKVTGFCGRCRHEQVVYNMSTVGEAVSTLRDWYGWGTAGPYMVCMRCLAYVRASRAPIKKSVRKHPDHENDDYMVAPLYEL